MIPGESLLLACIAQRRHNQRLQVEFCQQTGLEIAKFRFFCRVAQNCTRRFVQAWMFPSLHGGSKSRSSIAIHPCGPAWQALKAPLCLGINSRSVHGVHHAGDTHVTESGHQGLGGTFCWMISKFYSRSDDKTNENDQEKFI
mmetsp:Transcript_10466/g.16374  ORF Transcript_10466/g.16374 Transcript_10466/m.16374 type:complete len:142 (+) Transcript_10466:511-936(+)